VTEIINLNRARKAKARRDAAEAAAENRVRFGRAKAETSADRALADKAARALDGHKLEP
jgi:hypothetical protein